MSHVAEFRAICRAIGRDYPEAEELVRAWERGDPDRLYFLLAGDVLPDMADLLDARELDLLNALMRDVARLCKDRFRRRLGALLSEN